MPRITSQSFFLGLDLGQRRDYTAVCVVESAIITLDARNPVSFAWLEEHRLAIAGLHRFPLDTPYPEIVQYVSRSVCAEPLRHNSTLAIDATGVGYAVYDMFRETRLPVRTLFGVQITSGEHVSRDASFERIPRKLLLHNLYAATVNRAYCIAEGLPWAPDFLRELACLEVRMDDAGNESVGPAKRSGHDDLVFAAALALWFATRPECKGTRFNGPVPYAYSPHHL
ncbi:MAG: hypothetical protein U0Q16_16140 [Bryobacteraceae bacterium]